MMAALCGTRRSHGTMGPIPLRAPCNEPVPTAPARLRFYLPVMTLDVGTAAGLGSAAGSELECH